MSQATAKNIGRFLIFLGIINLIVVFAFEVFAKEVQVIDIRKNLRLANDEKDFTDYYLNAGADMNIKPGTVFTLYRRTSVIDRLGTNQGRPLSLPIGKVKIIYVSKDLSVARVDKLEKNENSPLVDFRGVMLGDLINVESAEMSAEGKKGKTYGPQGLDVSFQEQTIVLPSTPENSREIASAKSLNKNVIELKAESIEELPKSEKADVKGNDQKQEIDLAR